MAETQRCQHLVLRQRTNNHTMNFGASGTPDDTTNVRPGSLTFGQQLVKAGCVELLPRRPSLSRLTSSHHRPANIQGRGSPSPCSTTQGLCSVPSYCSRLYIFADRCEATYSIILDTPFPLRVSTCIHSFTTIACLPLMQPSTLLPMIDFRPETVRYLR